MSKYKSSSDISKLIQLHSVIDGDASKLFTDIESVEDMLSDFISRLEECIGKTITVNDSVNSIGSGVINNMKSTSKYIKTTSTENVKHDNVQINTYVEHVNTLYNDTRVNKHCKLNHEIIDSIISLTGGGMSISATAKKLGLSRNTVSRYAVKLKR